MTIQRCKLFDGNELPAIHLGSCSCCSREGNRPSPMVLLGPTSVKLQQKAEISVPPWVLPWCSGICLSYSIYTRNDRMFWSRLQKELRSIIQHKDWISGDESWADGVNTKICELAETLNVKHRLKAFSFVLLGICRFSIPLVPLFGASWPYVISIFRGTQ